MAALNVLEKSMERSESVLSEATEERCAHQPSQVNHGNYKTSFLTGNTVNSFNIFLNDRKKAGKNMLGRKFLEMCLLTFLFPDWDQRYADVKHNKRKDTKNTRTKPAVLPYVSFREIGNPFQC
jgi:hypothetical protein